MSQRDAIYRSKLPQIVDFAFDEAVVRVFPDMIRRSIPGYETVVPLSGLIAARYARANTRCYDLGCSLGATTLAIARYLNAPGCELYAVDNSEAMLARAQQENEDPRIHWLHSDIRDVPLHNASVVVMNYTLQFLRPDERQPLLRRIYNALVPGGVVLVSEKIKFSDPGTHARYQEHHAAFKSANGYSDLEISQKRAALERVMQPDTEGSHVQRFAEAGFRTVDVWFRCLNWASFLAFRE